MRHTSLAIVISLLFALLLAGLFYNQVLRYDYYSRLSKNNSIRIIPIEGPRGNIFDRSGIPLVTNRLSFDVAIIYQELRDRRGLARLLNDVTGMSGERIMAALEKAAKRPYAPVTILEDIDKEKAFMLEEASFDISGLIIETKSKRNYMYKYSGSHIFGYLGQISEDELGLLKDYGYRMRDLVGRDGIEKYYDIYLRGIDGGTQIEVDSRGRQTRMLGLKEPSSGLDLYLTIDIGLQQACDKLLGERKGAVIVMDPNDGEVLALSSHPAFDPNVFIRPEASADRFRFLNDRAGRPMFNRAISATYPPGSVFKIVTASAALETKKINPNTRFFCSGSYKLGNAEFRCWKEEGHLSQNLIEGLMNSCNVFFYNAGRAAGVDNIEFYAKLFGFGRFTGIDLPDEARGIVPGKAWKRMYRKQGWYEGETLNYSIGQGYLSVTPAQVLEMMTAMANKSGPVRPCLVKRIGATSLQRPKPKNISLKTGTIRKVREGLFEVINNESGTGKRAKVPGVAVAGKTGTAQNPQGRTHAWFCGFAPYDDPKICLVVLLEHGGKGGVEPAEIARGIFEEAKRRGYL